MVLALVFGVAFGAQLFGIVKANPFFNVPIVDPVPGTTPTGITILGPQNNTVYNSTELLLSFNVSKPELATAFQTGITGVYYFLDSEETEVYLIYNSTDNAPGRQNFTYSTLLTLPEGNHNLTVYTAGVVYPNNVSIFPVNSSSTVLFKVDTTATLPSTTENSPLNISAEAMYVIAILVAVVIVAAAVLVIKRKK